MILIREETALQSFKDLSTFEQCGKCNQAIVIIIIILSIQPLLKYHFHGQFNGGIYHIYFDI